MKPFFKSVKVNNIIVEKVPEEGAVERYCFISEPMVGRKSSFH